MEDFNFDKLEKHRVNPKVIGIISYFTFIGWIIAVVLNNPQSEKASFHIRQSLGIMLLGFVSSFATAIPFTGHLISRAGAILTFAMWIISFIGALQGQKRLAPLLGERFQEWFDRL